MVSIFEVDTSTGELIIAGISLHTYAFCALDLRRLCQTTEYRSGNVPMPGAHGERGYRMWRAGATHDVPMLLTGKVDMAGNVNANPWAGYQASIEYLETNLLDPPSSATVPASILMPDTSTKYAEVQVRGLQFQSFDPSARVFQRGSLTLRILAGRFA